MRDVFCDPGATRTRDPQLRRLLLYPTELRDRCYKENKKYFLKRKTPDPCNFQDTERSLTIREMADVNKTAMILHIKYILKDFLEVYQKHFVLLQQLSTPYTKSAFEDISVFQCEYMAGNLILSSLQ